MLTNQSIFITSGYAGAKLGEKGRVVAESFEYNSGTNPEVLACNENSSL
jgi:hypothetical protein